MTLMLDLPPDLEASVNSEAARRGISPSDYLVEIVRTAIETPPSPEMDLEPAVFVDLRAPWPDDEPRPTNGAELVAYWERHGVIGSRPDITDPVEYVREMRRKAETPGLVLTVLLLDADVLVDIQRSHPPAVVWYRSLTELPSVPGLVVMELLQHAQNQRQVQSALRLVTPLPVVWPTEADCARALADFTAFHLSHSLGLLDALIGACAIGRTATLCTFNVKHYQIIAGLMTEQPYSR